MYDDYICRVCSTQLKYYSGRNAHRLNLYCPKCTTEEEESNMSKTTELKLQQSIEHIKNHKEIAHKRILLEVGKAMIAFQKSTGCNITSVDIYVHDITSIDTKGRLVVPTQVRTDIYFRNSKLI